MNRAARRRAAKVNAKASRHNLTDGLPSTRSGAGATALDAIRVNGRDRTLETTFRLMESGDPGKRAVAEFMLRGLWEALL
jgi:hypothetical protein